MNLIEGDACKMLPPYCEHGERVISDSCAMRTGSVPPGHRSEAGRQAVVSSF